ncbi:hypothetical protein ACH5AO_31155 [Streptomyces sp. NPDC018964]|uniref:hypothetical protein n=1 Tax=unclassified Streptomyces TaxID=2593676 RepID=UPI0037BC7854
MRVNNVTRASAPATGLGSSTAVNVPLDRLGLGGLAGSDTSTPLGSNQSVTGTTDTGVDVFVKQVDPLKPDARRRFARMRDFEEFAAAHPVPELRAPRLLSFGEPELLIAPALSGAPRHPSRTVRPNPWSSIRCPVRPNASVPTRGQGDHAERAGSPAGAPEREAEPGTRRRRPSALVTTGPQTTSR